MTTNEAIKTGLVAKSAEAMATRGSAASAASFRHRSRAPPLYRCYSEAEKSHFAANSEDCDHAGKMEALLGYDLKQ